MKHEQDLKIFKKTLQEDKKLAFASNEERELRLKYPFANVFIQFPTTGDSLSFPAFLTNFQDNFAPSFTTIDVFGRVDPIPVYQNTRRTLGFTLTMPAYNESHAKEILRNVNTIVKNLYPSYVTPESQGSNLSSTRIINSPPLIRVKFANLICDYVNPSRGLLGYVNGQITITHGLETNGMFIVENGGDGVIYSKVYEVGFSLSALHEGTPGFDEKGEGEFIDGQHFPYQVDSSFKTANNNNSEGAVNPSAVSQATSRETTSNPSGLGSDASRKAKEVLGG